MLNQKLLRSCLMLIICLLSFQVQAEVDPITVKDLTVSGQGILPQSAITGIFSIGIAETNTAEVTDKGKINDDGGAILTKVYISIASDNGLFNPYEDIANVYLYRNSSGSSFKPYDPGSIKVGEDPIVTRTTLTKDSTFIVLDTSVIPREIPSAYRASALVTNSTAEFIVAIQTNSTLSNNAKFHLRLSSVDIVHEDPEASLPSGNIGMNSNVIACVDSAGDLTPKKDYLRSNGNDMDFPHYPHNYPDYRWVHPDARDVMSDLEVPKVFPSESTEEAILGFEVAGIGNLYGVVLNITSIINGVNDDNDAWADDPGPDVKLGTSDDPGTVGVFDPLIDEIFEDSGAIKGQLDPGDKILFEGATKDIQTQMVLYDDDQDGEIDEEKKDGLNNDFDYFVDEGPLGNNKTYEPGTDELYKDYDLDGRYANGSSLDVRIDTDGTASPEKGSRLDNIKSGSPLRNFTEKDLVGFIDANNNGLLDITSLGEVKESLILDRDADAVYTAQADLLVDADGSASQNVGTASVKPGIRGVSIQAADNLITNDWKKPATVWLDIVNPNSMFDAGEPIILGAPIEGQVGVNAASDGNWLYEDLNGNGFYDDGEDIWINYGAGDTYSQTADAEILSSTKPEANVAIIALDESSRLVFFDVNGNQKYDDGEDIVYELYAGGLTWTEKAEGLNKGYSSETFSLAPGSLYQNPLIDEDVSYVPITELIDEDMEDRYAWVDEPGLTPGKPDLPVDVNKNGIISPEDKDTGDEFYVDLNGNGRYDLLVNGIPECLFPGSDGIISLGEGSPLYTNWIQMDDDGDSEDNPTGDKTKAPWMDLRPIGGPLVKVADGIDNDGDGEIDEGINEDLGSFHFDALESYPTINDIFGTTFNPGDIEAFYLYRDNGDGVFNPWEASGDKGTDTKISFVGGGKGRNYKWLDITPPTYSVWIWVYDSDGNPLPMTDDYTYDYFVAVTFDGDDAAESYDGTLLSDGMGMRFGDKFQVSLAPGGILTDAGVPNAQEITKPIYGMLYIDDMIGYVPSTIQNDENGGAFVGNPYLEAECQPLAVLGINVACGDPGVRMEEVTVKFEEIDSEGRFDPAGTNDFPPDLAPLAYDDSSGVALYKDNPNAGSPGVFDEADTYIPLAARSLGGKLVPLAHWYQDTDGNYLVDLRPEKAVDLPRNDRTPENEAYDFFIVLRTSAYIDYRDMFRVSIPDRGIQFTNSKSVTHSGAKTDSISANVPVFLEDLTEAGQTLTALSEPLPVIGINLHDSNKTDNGLPARLEWLAVTFRDVRASATDTIDFSQTDLAPLVQGRESGVSLYRDKAPDNDDSNGIEKKGVFDPTDEWVPVDYDTETLSGLGFRVLMSINPFVAPENRGERIPPHDSNLAVDDNYLGNDYFIVIRTSADISNGDDFNVTVAPVVQESTDGHTPYVTWPMHFLPVESNPPTTLDNEEPFFYRTFSYKAITTKPIVATTQTSCTLFSLFGNSGISQQVPSNSDPVGVFGINVWDNAPPEKSLLRVKLKLMAGSGFELSDLAGLVRGNSTGLGLYRDQNGNNSLEPAEDLFIPATNYDIKTVSDGWEITINISTNNRLPEDDLGLNQGADFFVAIRTSNSIDYQDKFAFYIDPEGLEFNSGPSLCNDAVTSPWFTAQIPVVFADLSDEFGGDLDRKSPPTAVVGVNIYTGTNGQTEKLKSLKVQLLSDGETSFNHDHLLALSKAGGGIALYQDAAGTDISENGVFNADQDNLVILSATPEWQGQDEVKLVLAQPLALPVDDSGENQGIDLFITIRTSNALNKDSRFRIKVSQLEFTSHTSYSQILTSVLTGEKVNEAPVIDLLNPKLGDRANVQYKIEWSDYDDLSPNGEQALISLFYTPESVYQQEYTYFQQTKASIPAATELAALLVNSASTVMIADKIRQASDANEYLWDLTKIKLGPTRNKQVRVWATIMDDGNLNGADFSPGYLTIFNATPEFEFVTAGKTELVVRIGSPLPITWKAKDPEEDAVIELSLDRNDNGCDTHILLASGISEDASDHIDIDSKNFLSVIEVERDYYLFATISDGIGEPVCVYAKGMKVRFVPNAVPSMEFTSPATDVVLGASATSYAVAWQLSDPDNTPWFNLYYDTVGSGGKSGTLIKGPISATETAWLAWDITNLNSGTYYLYAKVEDGVNEAVIKYAPGSIFKLDSHTDLKQGMFILDGFGGIHSLGTKYKPANYPYFGWDIARRIVSANDGQGLWILDGFGGLHNIGSAGSLNNPAWFGWDIAKAFAVKREGTEGYLLDGFGGFWPLGQAQPFTEGTPAPYFGWDIARDLELNSAQDGAYILDGYGNVYAVGYASTLAVTPYFGWDIASRIEVVSQGLYLMDGFGGIHTIPLKKLTTYVLPHYTTVYYGWDIARGFEVMEGIGSLVLDGMGGLSNAGKVFPPDKTVYFGWDIAREVAFSGDFSLVSDKDKALLKVEEIVSLYAKEDLDSLMNLVCDNYQDKERISRTALKEDLRKHFENNWVYEYQLAATPEVTYQTDGTVLATGKVNYVEMVTNKERIDIERANYPSDCDFGEPFDRGSYTGLARFEVTLYVDQEVMVRDYADGRAIRLFIDSRKNDTDAWRPVTDWMLTKPRDEERTFHLTADRQGQEYAFTFVNYDCRDEQYGPPIIDIYYTETNPDSARGTKTVTWTFLPSKGDVCLIQTDMGQ